MGKSKKKRALIGLAAAVLAVVGLSAWLFAFDSRRRPVLETAAVEFGDLTVELPATGNIDAVNVVEVGSVVSGRIESLHADFNQRVKAGQLLAVIEESDYRAGYLQARADVTAAQAGIEVAAAAVEGARSDQVRAVAAADRAKTLLENARIDYERNQKLSAAGLATRAESESIEARYKSALADAESAKALFEQAGSKLKSAQAGVEQARAVAEQRAARAAMAKKNLEYCRITSPVNGVVVSRDVDVGQTVAARLQAPPLYHIAEDLSQMYVYTKLDSSDVAKIHPGLPATFTVNAYPGEVYEGKLTEVRINPNPEAPVSRAAPVGQFQRTISAGVSAAGSASSDLAAQPATGGSSGGSGSGGSSRSSSSSSALPTTSTTQSASAAPPTATRNTVVVYDALIEFRNPDEKLLPGMTAYVTIPLQSVKDKLKVPSAALRFSPNIPEQEKQRLMQESGAPADATIVWVVDGKKYKPVAVKPVLTDYVYTAVESTELKPGMQVGIKES